MSCQQDCIIIGTMYLLLVLCHFRYKDLSLFKSILNEVVPLRACES